MRGKLESDLNTLGMPMQGLSPVEAGDNGEVKPEITSMAADLQAVEDELAQLRSTVAELESAPSTQAVAQKPVLAILALLIGLGAAGFALLLQQLDLMRTSQEELAQSMSDNNTKQVSFCLIWKRTNSSLQEPSPASLPAKQWKQPRKPKPALPPLKAKAISSTATLRHRCVLTSSSLTPKTLLQEELTTIKAQMTSLAEITSSAGVVSAETFSQTVADLNMKLKTVTDELERILDDQPRMRAAAE